MNSLMLAKTLVEQFDTGTAPFVGPQNDQRFAGWFRVLNDGWGFPVAVVGDFATSWGDRIVVCEIIPLPERHTFLLRLAYERVKQKMVFEIACYIEEIASHPNDRKGPFSIPVGVEGDGI
jgi:hypothetical protein